MAASINLLFGVHNHQPVGNFEHIFKKAVAECYRPFVDAIYNFPQINVSFHFSGSLIDWLLKYEAGLLEKVKDMVKRAQAEILSGGYYEPILPIIPEIDRQGQIKMLSDFIKDYFEIEPKGMWLGERVWDPRLTKSLAQAGIKYTFLDEDHFLRSGISKEKLCGYYICDYEDQQLAIFPISKELRYTIPFSVPAHAIAYLKGLAGDECRHVVTIVDDGEKFGLWPGTHKWVYQKKWLENFLQLIVKNRDWLKTLRIEEYFNRYEPLGRCNLLAGGYAEMMKWAGGAFGNFFTRYPEANHLHKRMLYVSNLLSKEDVKDPQAQRHLYMGQCNCPYWHGVFGGLYLGHLRHHIYKNLIIAESYQQNQGQPSGARMERCDFDQDGKEELIIRNRALNVFVSAEQGGAILELDYKPKSLNLTDVLTRREEVYHQNIRHQWRNIFLPKRKRLGSIYDLLGCKERNLEKLLIYDAYRRLSLLDHFFTQHLTVHKVKNMQYQELGDFIQAPYLIAEEQNAKGLSVMLQRDGALNLAGEKVPLSVSKRLRLNEQQARLDIDYQLRNLEKRSLEISFGVEFNLSAASQAPMNKLSCSGACGDESFSLHEDIQINRVKQIQLLDAVRGIKCAFYFDQDALLYSFPLETISASETGFERNYQQTVIIPCWSVSLTESWQTHFSLEISSTR